MKVLEAKFVEGFMRMANDGWEQGWHERNGGNLSYRIKPEEVESVKEEFNPGDWREIGTEVKDLAGEYFLVTGSGKYFRNVVIDPTDSVGIIEVDETGSKYRIVWGFVNGGRPTSELPSHLYALRPGPGDHPGAAGATGSSLGNGLPGHAGHLPLWLLAAHPGHRGQPLLCGPDREPGDARPGVQLL